MAAGQHAPDDTEEDFTSLRDSFSALRHSIQQELLRTGGGAHVAEPAPPAPAVRAGAGPPLESEEAVGSQFYQLRDSLL